jgi:hypothetical protein
MYPESILASQLPNLALEPKNDMNLSTSGETNFKQTAYPANKKAGELLLAPELTESTLKDKRIA